MQYHRWDPSYSYLIAILHNSNIEIFLKVRTTLNFQARRREGEDNLHPPLSNIWSCCAMQPRCMRCADNYDTGSCPNKNTEDFKCANCNELHTANEPNCLKFRNFLKNRAPQSQKTNEKKSKTSSNDKRHSRVG